MENSFCPKFWTNGPKKSFWKLCHLIFIKEVQNETFFHRKPYLWQNSCSVVIDGNVDCVAGFFKVLLSFGFSLENPCLAKFLFCIYQPKCSWPVRLQDSLKCNIFRKNWGINLIFCLWINIKVSYKVAFSVWISFSKMYREKFQ